MRLKNKGYAKPWGGKQGVSIMGDVQKLELCASSQVLKTLKQMQGRTRPLWLVLRELITVSGAGGGGRLYNMPAEGGGSFGIDGEIFLLNSFMTPNKNYLSLTKRSFDQRVTRILKVSYTHGSY